MKKFIPLLFIGATLFLPYLDARAHATPIKYTPESGSVLEFSPDRVTIQFSERIENGASSIKVFSPNGESSTPETAQTEPDTHFYGVALNDKGRGTYTVSWQVVSADDGHFTKGAFSFSVGQVSTTNPGDESTTVVHSSAVPESIAIGLELFGTALLFSLMLFHAAVGRSIRKKFLQESQTSAIGIYDSTLQWLIVSSLFLILSGILYYLFLRTSELAGLQNVSFADAFDRFETTVSGSFAIFRGLGATVIAGILFFSWKRIRESDSRRTSEMVVFLLILVMLFLRARVSHAAASSFYPGFSVFINFLHLGFKDLWVGTATVVALLLLRGKGILSELTQSELVRALSRFAAISIIGGGITGAYIVWLHLKDFENISTTLWGDRFLILGALATFFLGIRLYQEFFQKTIRPFLIMCEALLGVLVLFTTSLLIITTPPLHIEETIRQYTVYRGVRIDLMEHEHHPGYLFITFTDAANEDAVEIGTLTLTATNKDKGIGPIIVQTQKSGNEFSFPEIVLSPPGEWKLDVTGTQPQTYDAVASFTFTYPPAPQETGIRFFDLFFALSALGAAGFGLFLWKKRSI